MHYTLGKAKKVLSMAIFEIHLLICHVISFSFSALKNMV
jgi:hypothetical protein